MPQFDYSPPPAVRHRKRFQRWAIIGAIVVVLFAAWQQGPWWWREVRRTYYERQCLAYVAPADQIIFEEDASKGARYTCNPPGCWTERLAVGWSLVPANLPTPVFLHERTTSDGARILVAVIFKEWNSTSGLELYWETQKGESGSASSWFIRARGSAATNTVRLFAGQPDAADASHFTIGYQMDGQPGTIDGWLRHDRSVELKVRDGPLMPQ